MCVSMNTGAFIFLGVFLVCSTTELTNSSRSTTELTNSFQSTTELTNSSQSTTEIFISYMDEETYKPNYSICSDLSTCNQTVSPKKGLYKCMCDSKCAVYGDCCPESVHYNSSELMNRKYEDMFSCPEQFGFYVRDRCPSAFADNDVRKKCENVSFDPDYADIKMLKPVQDKISRITYLNAYCALCNGATNFESFKLDYYCYEKLQFAKMLSKEELRSILLQAKFNPETRELTATVPSTVEYRCSHKVITPEHLKPHLRYCEPGMVSSCPPTFNDSKVADACRSLTYAVYTSPYVGSGVMYKNIHCANCNGEESAKLSPCQVWDLSGTKYAASTLFLIPQNGVCDDEDFNIPVC